MAVTDEQLIKAGLDTGLLEQSTIDALRAVSRRQRQPILASVLAKYRIPLSALYRAVAEQAGLVFMDVTQGQVNVPLSKKMPASLINRKQQLVLTQANEDYLVITDPFDRAGLDAAERLIGQHVKVVMSDPESLRLLIKKYLSNTAVAQVTDANSPDTDLISLLDNIFRDAYLNRSSDIHMQTEEDGLRVRLRVDGRLVDYPIEADQSAAAGLISRVKVLAGLDIAEQRMPQDGGFSYYLAPPVDLEFNIRVATAPTRLGERITMRLLGQESVALTLTDLGFLDSDLQEFRKAIHQPYGMILLTGPTGSGKSTTLFAALQEINAPDINIMTVENPIEYVIDGVSQIQTGPKITFADALRSLLRHDPDVLMVGEIRDTETADVAVKAAMTGHMVFSTLHTNNAISAVTRLVDIGCEPFLIGSTMTAVIGQRLVRRLCQNCAKPRQATKHELALLGQADDVEVFDAIGCAVCQGKGFSGRLGLFETLWFDEKLARLVAKGADEETLENQAGNKLKFMWQDGCEKVLRGLTTLEEVQNVAPVKSLAVIEAN
ncbi:GspE/PulE family protein [Methylophaga sp. OBS3]|uniref:GspE/PulE family protein n=1 Tax=Methylophaga sp. OBS3 TaxID=2991934 RepID=UPI0022579807|nr:GspE/PulE family protein [Methylophaga sp. OBS3]MCX4189165.1 GspE/PulE family protein [Methylophaga sp. OBS3]